MRPTSQTVSIANGDVVTCDGKGLLSASIEGVDSKGNSIECPAPMPVYTVPFDRNLLSALQHVKTGNTVVLSPSGSYIRGDHHGPLP